MSIVATLSIKGKEMGGTLIEVIHTKRHTDGNLGQEYELTNEAFPIAEHYPTMILNVVPTTGFSGNAGGELVTTDYRHVKLKPGETFQQNNIIFEAR